MAQLRELGAAVLWLTPIPRTLMKRGVLEGERDVKVSLWRVRRWAHQLSRLMLVLSLLALLVQKTKKIRALLARVRCGAHHRQLTRVRLVLGWLALPVQQYWY